MESTTVQRRPWGRRREALQIAHPLDPLCDLLASSVDQFFVHNYGEDCRGRGSVTIYKLNGQPLAPEGREWLSEIKMLTYSIANNLRTRFYNIIK
jgi:hypothetical protein